MSYSDPSLSPVMALLAQAERERDAGMGVLRKADAAHVAAQQQVDQLQAYRRDYEARFRARFQTPGGVDVFQSYQGFMTRLTAAVEQQQQVVELAASRMHEARQQLVELEMRVLSVRKLLERRLIEQRLLADRREQKETDELASRAAWARLGGQHLPPPH